MKSRIAIYTTTNINATKLAIAADIASNEKYNATEGAIGEIMNLLPPTTGTTFLASTGSSDIELIDYMGDEFHVTCLTTVETDADDYRTHVSCLQRLQRHRAQRLHGRRTRRHMPHQRRNRCR